MNILDRTLRDARDDTGDLIICPATIQLFGFIGCYSIETVSIFISLLPQLINRRSRNLSLMAGCGLGGLRQLENND